MQDDWRKKIRAANILTRLYDHVEGKNELSATQIKAADIILKKLEPDLNKSDVQQLDKDGNKADAGFTINIKHIKADDKTD